MVTAGLTGLAFLEEKKKVERDWKKRNKLDEKERTATTKNCAKTSIAVLTEVSHYDTVDCHEESTRVLPAYIIHGILKVFAKGLSRQRRHDKATEKDKTKGLGRTLPVITRKR